VARRPPGAVLAHIGLDRNRQRRTHRLTQLAGNAAFLAVRIPPQCVQPPVAVGLRRLLLRVLDRDVVAEKVAERDAETLPQLPQRERLECFLDLLHEPNLQAPPTDPSRSRPGRLPRRS